MIAIIIGSSGLTGSQLLEKLLADNTIEQVISVSRRCLKIPHKKLTEVLIPDFSNLASAKDALKGDLYFCCLGTTIKKASSKDNFRKIDHDAIVEFGKIAKAHQAQSFAMVSAMGANIKSTFFYNQIKGETEKDLINLGLPSLLIFRPSLLIGPRQEFRLAENIFSHILVPLGKVLPNKVKKTLITETKTLAEKMWQESKNRESKGTQIFAASSI